MIGASGTEAHDDLTAKHMRRLWSDLLQWEGGEMTRSKLPCGAHGAVVLSSGAQAVDATAQAADATAPAYAAAPADEGVRVSIGFSVGFGATFPCDTCADLASEFHVGAMASPNLAVLAEFGGVGGDDRSGGGLLMVTIGAQYWPVERFWIRGASASATPVTRRVRREPTAVGTARPATRWPARGASPSTSRRGAVSPPTGKASGRASAPTGTEAARGIDEGGRHEHHAPTAVTAESSKAKRPASTSAAPAAETRG